MPKEVSEVDLAYFAGIFDGEGTVCISKHKYEGVFKSYNNYHLSVIISNTNLALINWIIERFGGRISILKSNTLNLSKLQCHQVWWQNEDAKIILRQISKYLVVKKKRVEFVLNEYPKQFLRDSVKREFCYNRVREFNKNSENTDPQPIPSLMAESGE